MESKPMNPSELGVITLDITVAGEIMAIDLANAIMRAVPPIDGDTYIYRIEHNGHILANADDPVEVDDINAILLLDDYAIQNQFDGLPVKKDKRL
jgi:hypothetical protein